MRLKVSLNSKFNCFYFSTVLIILSAAVTSSTIYEIVMIRKNSKFVTRLPRSLSLIKFISSRESQQALNCFFFVYERCKTVQCVGNQLAGCDKLLEWHSSFVDFLDRYGTSVSVLKKFFDTTL